MKKLLLVAIAATSFSGLANANNSIYASLKSGISDTKYKNSKEIFTSKSSSPYEDIESYVNDNLTKSTYPNISAAVGFDFSKISNINARSELEYTYKNSDTFSPAVNTVVVQMDNQTTNYPVHGFFYVNKLKMQSLMLNGYYDFKNTSKFTPYVGTGVGVTRIKSTRSLANETAGNSIFSTDSQFTWSAGIGIAYTITSNVALDLGYKYTNFGNFKFSNENPWAYLDTKVKLSSQDYSLGIRYNF
jgi:opacity protein-like surface antigen